MPRPASNVPPASPRAVRLAAVWRTRIVELARFAAEHGHSDVPEKWPENPGLARFILTQRVRLARGSLPRAQLDELLALGFHPRVREGRWERRYRELAVFHERFGHCKVPRHWSENPTLSTWVRDVRATKRRGDLSAERERKLVRLGFVFKPREEVFESWLRELERFKRAHGHARVPAAREGPWGGLSVWLQSQREHHRAGRLPAAKVKRLEKAGFSFASHEGDQIRWEQQFRSLKAFIRENGHPFVPGRVRRRRFLNLWLRRERQKARRGNLDAARRARLVALGVPFDPQEAAWQKRYQELAAFHRRHGHIDVPHRPPYRSLYGWAAYQRDRAEEGKLSRDKRARLDQLSFRWVKRGFRSEGDLVSALVAFRREHGHWAVPLRHPYKDLAKALERARRGRLSPDTLAALAKAQVPLRTSEVAWERHFAELGAYTRRYGRGASPRSGTLARFVASQRRLAGKGELPLDLERRLAEIGILE